MGGCYSNESHRTHVSPPHKQPKAKYTDNGKGPHCYFPVSSKESHREGNSKIDNNSRMPHAAKRECLPGRKEGQAPKGVAPSDSGIVSLGSPQKETNPVPKEGKKEITLCKSCHAKLQRISRGACLQCGNLLFDATEVSALVDYDTYCTCGPRQVGKKSNCRTHGARGQISPSHRYSDIPDTASKSNLKKNGFDIGDGKHVRMSMTWKSSDSLNMRASMNTCMDRTKSEASEVFGDDVSFKAPLAQFEETGKGECGTHLLTSRMSIYSEILDMADCICKCDFSVDFPQVTDISADGEGSCLNILSPDHAPNGWPGVLPSHSEENLVQNSLTCLKLKEIDDKDGRHWLTKSEGYSGSISGVKNLAMEEGKNASPNSSSVRHAVAEMVEKVYAECEEVVCPVSLAVKGRQLILMDVDIYTQMINDLAVLRDCLSHLTSVIQEEEDFGLAPLNLSRTTDE